MKKKNFWYYPFTLMGILCMITNSCEKDNDSSYNPINGLSNAVFNSNLTYGTMTDQNGNIYKTIVIGTQTWMAENLRTKKYNDGTTIPNVKNTSKWGNLTSAAFCTYDNTNNSDSINTYGMLYNGYAIQTGKLAPIGWHIPTNEEWETLITYLGGGNVGGKLKEIGTIHWNNPNVDADNSSGFTALPGGYHGYNYFFAIGNAGYWWSSTWYDSTFGYHFSVVNDSGTGYKRMVANIEGYSVRCVMD
jgi:uncharacterized protein (TIGR02145 family)